MRCSQTDNHFKAATNYILMTKTNQRAEREQYTRSNAAIARPISLVKPAETLARDH